MRSEGERGGEHAASELDSINRSFDEINVLITGLVDREVRLQGDDH